MESDDRCRTLGEPGREEVGEDILSSRQAGQGNYSRRGRGRSRGRWHGRSACNHQARGRAALPGVVDAHRQSGLLLLRLYWDYETIAAETKTARDNETLGVI